MILFIIGLSHIVAPWGRRWNHVGNGRCLSSSGCVWAWVLSKAKPLRLEFKYATVGSKKLEHGHVLFPALEGFGVGGRSCSSFLASTVRQTPEPSPQQASKPYSFVQRYELLGLSDRCHQPAVCGIADLFSAQEPAKPSWPK